MFERRSEYFAGLLDALGVTYAWLRPGCMDNNFVLRFDGASLRLYFNDATDKRGAYFAAQSDFYSGFAPQHWLDARNQRREELHMKLVPYPGEEFVALESIIAFARSRADAL
jgi:hypothetical protein